MNGVTVDVVTKNIYWTDGLNKLIGVKPLATDVHVWKVIVDSDLSSPQDVVINPIHQYVIYKLFDYSSTL